MNFINAPKEWRHMYFTPLNVQVRVGELQKSKCICHEEMQHYAYIIRMSSLYLCVHYREEKLCLKILIIA